MQQDKISLFFCSGQQSFMPKCVDLQLFVGTADPMYAPPGSVDESGGACKQLVLIDDLPFVNSQELQIRLVRALVELAVRAQNPTICILLDSSFQSSGNHKHNSNGYSLNAKIRDALNNCNVDLISLPPVTKTSVLKALKRVVELKNLSHTSDSLELISASANGDIRSAISMLQTVSDASAEQLQTPPRKVPCHYFSLHLANCASKIILHLFLRDR